MLRHYYTNPHQPATRRGRQPCSRCHMRESRPANRQPVLPMRVPINCTNSSGGDGKQRHKMALKTAHIQTFFSNPTKVFAESNSSGKGNRHTDEAHAHPHQWIAVGLQKVRRSTGTGSNTRNTIHKHNKTRTGAADKVVTTTTVNQGTTDPVDIASGGLSRAAFN
mmetsp:Transcript_49004/g.49358  ORF Transcript_49004/g.49358 Transcript_49004/m.49358 type:complete len:165 (+) Transcript_49004:1518-2012(+)